MSSDPLVALVARALAGGGAPPRTSDAAALAPTLGEVRCGLAGAKARAEALALPLPELAGQLYRPLVALAGARALGLDPDEDLWLAALAIQYAHEASLLHDDVIDGAATRRGQATVAHRHGVARALVEGDHLLTAAYRLAGETGSVAFMRAFATSVERTVAGEKRQAAARGTVLGWDRYTDIVTGKSGELFGCAFAAAAALQGHDPRPWVVAGRRVGAVYQMVDDLLDYCPHAETGKAPLGDYRNGLWTWIRLDAEDLPAGLSPDGVARRLFRSAAGPAPMRRALARLSTVMRDVGQETAALGEDAGIVESLLTSWRSRAEEAVRAEEAALVSDEAAGRVRVLTGGRSLTTPAERLAYFGEHGRTFRFAARLFPPDVRAQVANVYAFCRLTDDLVDRQPDVPQSGREALLDAWHQAAADAYDGIATGIPVLDAAMGDMAERRVPFRYASELIAGARMDLGPVRFHTLEELRHYTFRVASVVGLWLTELFGVRDPAVLERAAAMGHAMQLTNILRDVGEDLQRGRLYLPTRQLSEHDLTHEDLVAVQRTNAPLPAGYAELCENLLQLAERQYGYAFEALPALPGFFRRPVAVAARAYAGIHDAIRRNGYDNLRHRAATSLPRKVVLGIRGLRELGAERQRSAGHPMAGIVTAS